MGQKQPRGRGRPSLLTPELTTGICNAVRSGLPIELAAEANGVSRQTVLEWVRRGEGREDEDRPPDELFAEFANRYRKARAEFAILCLQPCIEAIRGTRPSKRKKDENGKPVNVRALGATTRAGEAHWHLARRYPEFWGAGREMVGLEGGEGPGDTQSQGVTIEIVHATDEELAK